MLEQDFDCGGPPPSAGRLATAFGFTVPSAFVRLVDVLFAFREENGLRDWDFLDTALGLHPGGDELRYGSTPPEFFPVATTGVDGVAYGYVIHAPELARDDYPVGEFACMDPGGVVLVGTSTLPAVEALLSAFGRSGVGARWLGRVMAFFGASDARLGERLAAHLGLHPSEANFAARYSESGDGLPLLPEVPEGFRYCPTSDGVGVLAAAAAFGPETRVGSGAVDLGAAKEELAAGHPASALVLLREAYWTRWTEPATAKTTSDLMEEAYRALGRPELAEVVARRCVRASKVFAYPGAPTEEERAEGMRQLRELLAGKAKPRPEYVRVTSGPPALEARGDERRIAVTLREASGAPCNDKPFVLTTRGVERRGSTGPNGELTALVPATATVARVVITISEAPEAPRLAVYLVDLTGGDASTLRGARIRLENLGGSVIAGPDPRADPSWLDELPRRPRPSVMIRDDGPDEVDTLDMLVGFMEEHGLRDWSAYDRWKLPDRRTQAKLVELHGY